MPLPHETRQAAYLTVGVWILWAVLHLAPMHVFEEPVRPATAISMGVVVALGIALSAILFKVGHRVREAPPATKITIIAIAAAAASMVLAILDAAINSVVVDALGAEPIVPVDIRLARNAAAFVWKFVTLGAVYAVLENNRAGRERERLLAEAQEAASSARLAALRYQLNPHFLFNTLNAISSLVVTRRTGDAEAMLEKLSGFLRATLAADPDGQTTVEDELAMLQHYLEIESVRFRDRLAVDFVCPPGLHDALLPSFLLQPLIENSIKYAVSPTRRPVTIRVEGARDGDDLVVVVEDDGDAADMANTRPGTGLGIANIRQRLNVLYGARGSLETVRRERGFMAVVRLPLVQRTAVAVAA